MGTALKVVLVGGSGFLGRGLRQRLVGSGQYVSVVGRGPSADHGSWEDVHWDAENLGAWVGVHLTGKRVDCRPSPSNIDQLIASRVDTVRLVGRAIETLGNPPDAWVQLSLLAIFGDSGDVIVDESTPALAVARGSRR